VTFVRDGAVRQSRFERILVPRRELVRAALNHPNAPSDAQVATLQVRGLSWSSRREVVALIEARYAFGLSEGIYILDSRAARSVRIPVTARDLAWR
jgi:hypothetical protein